MEEEITVDWFYKGDKAKPSICIKETFSRSDGTPDYRILMMQLRVYPKILSLVYELATDRGYTDWRQSRMSPELADLCKAIYANREVEVLRRRLIDEMQASREFMGEEFGTFFDAFVDLLDRAKPKPQEEL